VFTLFGDLDIGLISTNISSGKILAIFKPFRTGDTYEYQAFSVYEIETSTTEESFLVAITNGPYI
jgi:hypothetical protein